jgi:hypothetical protein
VEEDMSSPFELARSLQTQVARLLSGFDIHDLPAAEREILVSIKRQVADIRLDIRDYGMAETKAEQDKAAKELHTRLKDFEATAVQAGGQGLFGAVDVAHLSAVTQQLMSNL